MFKLANERSPATNQDIIKGREAQKTLHDYWNIINTKGFVNHWFNKEKDANQLFDFCSYNEKLDFCIPVAVEAKDRELFNKVLNGYNNNGNSKFKDIHFANKNYHELMSNKTRDSCKHIIDRSLTDEELTFAVSIIIPLDAPKKLDFGFKINIYNSIYKYIDLNKSEKLKNGKEMFHNSRRNIKEIKRESRSNSELDYILEIPFNEVKLNDYRF